MADKYDSARLKLGRAKHHISDFERVSVQTLEAYRLKIKPDLDTGNSIVKFSSEALDPALNLIFGDAIVNMRSALDHCYAVAVGAENERTGQNFFPIRDTRKNIETVFEDTKKKRPLVPKVLQDLILNEIKPYNGGDEIICGLNTLANIDKHRLLITIIGKTILTFSYTHGNITFKDCTLITQAGEKRNISSGPGAPEFKGEQKATLQINIDEREPSIFYGKPVVPTLISIADKVSSVIEAVAAIIPYDHSHSTAP